MTEAKHTPGPWKQHPDYQWIIKEDNAPISDEGVTIASTTAHEGSGFFPNPSQGRANARLIAAAPDMLEALNLCRQHMYEHASNTPDNAFEKLCAAIAKATGN